MPNVFSINSLRHLKTSHIDLQLIFFEVLKLRDCSIVEGHRGMERQNFLFNSIPQRSKVQWPKGSHNKTPSMALDTCPSPYEPKKKLNFYYFAGIVFAVTKKLLEEGRISHDIRWGGDWDSDGDFTDQEFNDLMHWELVTISASN